MSTQNSSRRTGMRSGQRRGRAALSRFTPVLAGMILTMLGAESLQGCASVPRPLARQEERVEQYQVDPGLPRCTGREDRNQSCVLLVSFSAQPWMDVFLDSHYVGRTPMTDVRILPKAYKMRLVNSSQNLDYATQKSFEVPPEGERISLNFAINN